MDRGILMTEGLSARALANGWKLAVDARGRGMLIGQDGAHHHLSDLLALSEVADLYGVDRGRIYSMMRKRILRGAKKYGAIYLVSVQEVVKSLDREAGALGTPGEGS
jgi:hypothetical protein